MNDGYAFAIRDYTGYCCAMSLIMLSTAISSVVPWLSCHMDLVCMAASHTFEFDLYPILIRFNMLSMCAGDGINNIDKMIDSVMWCNSWYSGHLSVRSPMVRVHNCDWCYMCLNNWENCSCISSAYHLHVTPCWSVRGVDQTKHRQILVRPSTAVMLQRSTKLNHTYALLQIVIYMYYTFGLCWNCDSSTWTIFPGPPRIIGVCSSVVMQTARSHW